MPPRGSGLPPALHGQVHRKDEFIPGPMISGEPRIRSWALGEGASSTNHSPWPRLHAQTSAFQRQALICLLSANLVPWTGRDLFSGAQWSLRRPPQDRSRGWQAAQWAVQARGAGWEARGGSRLMSDYRPSSLTACQRAHREPCSISRVAGGAGGNILPTFGSSLGCGWVNGVQTPLSSLFVPPLGSTGCQDREF